MTYMTKHNDLFKIYHFMDRYQTISPMATGQETKWRLTGDKIFGKMQLKIQIFANFIHISA